MQILRDIFNIPRPSDSHLFIKHHARHFSHSRELRRTAWQALLEESLKVCGTHAAADKQQTQPRRARFLLPRELPCWPEGDTVDPRLILNARAAEFYARCKARVAARVPHMLMRCAHCLIRRYAGCGTGGLMLECAAPDGRKRRLYLQCHRALCRMEVREAAMQDDTMQDATMKGSARARRRDPAERLRRGSERSR